ncbi:hypothetical protein D2E24_0952 [Bifidobacterium samirii]|uniref:Uncharacterized protein n=1 Tax=Bifidobacterium samirii TaxID=2306974 RepID=A0A430FUM8_9BIFI|nr:hypothetical protein D2E24_0952 [Bifidobacterium samirii]
MNHYRFAKFIARARLGSYVGSVLYAKPHLSLTAMRW